MGEQHPVSGSENVVNQINHAASLDCVPEIWVEILRHMSTLDRQRHLPFVNRTLSVACRDPTLWRHVEVDLSTFQTETRWESFMTWLALRASALQNISLTNDGHNRIGGQSGRFLTAELITLLAASAPVLQSLTFGVSKHAPAKLSALPAAFGQLSQLTSLSLSLGRAIVTTAQVDTMLLGLTSLQSLTLEGSLGTRSCEDGLPVRGGNHSSNLQSLNILNLNLGAIPSLLGSFKSLTSLQLYNCGVLSLPDSISSITGLRELDLTLNGCLNTLPMELAACRYLTALSIEAGCIAPVLEMMDSLRCLSIGIMRGIRLCTSYWSELSGLTELMLRHSCDGNDDTGIPETLSEMTGLRKLTVIGCQVADLPKGPYLTGLMSLHMFGCFFNSGVPPSLAAARQLTCLELCHQNAGFELTVADVALLSSLPELRSITLRTFKLPRAVWVERLAYLKAACDAQHRAQPVTIKTIRLY